MLLNICFRAHRLRISEKSVYLHCVFHGIRFKVIKIGCRDDNQFFFLPVGEKRLMTN